MSFEVPYSSSPPSTPGSKRSNSQDLTTYTSMPNNPSTTPAGPPPSSAASFTPDGPPPSSIFGSSQPKVGKIDWGKKPSQMHDKEAHKELPRTKSGTPRNNKFVGSSHFQRFADSKPFPGVGSFRSSAFPISERTQEVFKDQEDRDGEVVSDQDLEGVDEGEEGEEEEDEEADEEDMDMDYTDIPTPEEFMGNTARANYEPVSSVFNYNPPGSQSMLARSTAKGMASLMPSHSKHSNYPQLARDLASRETPARLDEPNELILGTEEVIAQFHTAKPTADHASRDHRKQSSDGCQDLLHLWTSFAQPGLNLRDIGEERPKEIGPGPRSSPFTKAVFLASLLLPLHHPPALQDTGSFDGQSVNSRSRALTLYNEVKFTPIPKVLLDWLDKSHRSYDHILRGVRRHQPNCTSSSLFWPMVFSLVLRGRLSDVVQLLANANFQYAITSHEDGRNEDGYHGAQQQIVQQLVNSARQVLEACPGYRSWQLGNSRIRLASVSEEGQLSPR